MNEEIPQGDTQQKAPFFLPPLKMTFVERYNISPFIFAIFSLAAVLVLYQVMGGLIIALMFGFKPEPNQVMGMRLATGFGQILFIFVPTLILVRFVTFSPGRLFRTRLPDFRLFGLALIGIFSLQQILEIIVMLQEKIPIPKALERFLEPIKQLFEELTKMLVGSNSVSELILVIMVIALIPAIAEEFLFRGLVMRCFERSLGSMWSVVITGTIFGLYHLNPFEIIPLVMLGIYLSFLAMRADSIWVSVVAHFFNNAIACIALYYHMDEDALVTGNPASMSAAQLLFTVFLFGSIFIVSTYAVIKLTKKDPPDSISFPGDETLA